MQLRPTKQYYGSSSEYKTVVLLVDQRRPTLESQFQSQRLRPPFLLFLSPDDFIRNRKTETSIFLKPQKDIASLELLYTFEQPEEIKKFLWTHQFLIDTCFKAYDEIKRIFGENTLDVSLEFDKDTEEDFQGISIIVTTNLSPDLSLDLLEKIDEEWWLDLSNEIRNIMTVMVRPL